MISQRFSHLDSKDRRGVAAIFFVLVFGVLIGFFMIILNTGVLVYQKMRLQSSVDLAAYAAASVQASYLGNAASGEDSIRGINAQIMERYGRLLNELQFGSIAAWPGAVLIPTYAACMALCQAANLVNGARAKAIYESAARDIDELREKARVILEQMPEAARKAAEETLRLNIPDLSVESAGIEALLSQTSSQAQDVIQNANSVDSDERNPQQRKNAVLTFTSQKGMYLANVVAAVPHSFAYFGPSCGDFYMFKNLEPFTPRFFCTVNGAGFPGGDWGWLAALAAFSRSYIKESSGNIGNLSSISDSDSNAIRLFFLQNPHKPDPFAVVAAEWYPENGVFMNVENSLASSGSLFPKSTKLMAIAAAEPYGGDLATQSANQFGVRLQSIRKLLLDPRMSAVKDDYPNLYEYFGTVGPRDPDGQPLESPHETIKRFLH